ncbi:IclR family transcriptional regulator [Pallidibacillus thermolactis]|jgi:IclR family transcriptional regulator, acetate operon repressor|uniref:hypothetical protein n=1 Tax=Pallidibacillus thermolactis TaxID=251051 RepID=UPI0021DB7887|nr:hypothetical protein [Pallidibacillus thermolactis]MCU9600978.1 hypothetical protein [Pallidibacillus thermolactis subsp. kokeshiiformis]
MTKSNLHKHLFTLCEFGVVSRNPSTNTYSLGPKLIQLGHVATRKSPLIEISIPYLKKISEQTNFTALLAIPTPKGPIVSYISSAEYGINIGAQIGSTLPYSLLQGAFSPHLRMKYL